MNGKEFQGQVNDYLMGELSPAQATAFERALDRDSELRILLREREEEMERQTLEIAPQVDPSSAVRERLLAATSADLRLLARSTDNDNASFSGRNSPSAPALAGWPMFFRRALAGAAILLLLAAGVGLWGWRAQTQQENDALRSQVRSLAAENGTLKSAREEATATREAREQLEREFAAVREQAANNGRNVAALREQLARTGQDLSAVRNQDVFNRLQVGSLQPSPGALLPASAPHATAGGLALWDPQRQQGMLVVENLPVPRPDQDYQVWVADPARPQPVPSGVFHPTRAGSQQTLRFVTNERIERAVQFMVTLERKGGVNRITGPSVLESLPTR